MINGHGTVFESIHTFPLTRKPSVAYRSSGRCHEPNVCNSRMNSFDWNRVYVNCTANTLILYLNFIICFIRLSYFQIQFNKYWNEMEKMRDKNIGDLCASECSRHVLLDMNRFTYHRVVRACTLQSEIDISNNIIFFLSLFLTILTYIFNGWLNLKNFSLGHVWNHFFACFSIHQLNKNEEKQFNW